MEFLALYTDHLMVILVILVLLAGWRRKLTGPQVFFVLLTAVMAWLLGNLIKSTFYLPRPYLASGQLPLVGYLLDGSFPSNHALFSFTLSFAVYSFKRSWGFALLFISLLISWGRILAHVHSAFDVFGAVVLAVVVVLFSRKFLYPQLQG